MADSVIINPDRDYLSDHCGHAARAARYRYGGRSGCWPFDHGAFARAVDRRYPDGHWAKVGQKRAVALAWWDAPNGRRRVRIVGVYRQERPTHPFAAARAVKDAPPWLYVYPMPGDLIRDVAPHLLQPVTAGGIPVGCLIPPEFARGLTANPGDGLTWLVLCDWLDEHGHDAAALRAIFQAEHATT